MTIEHCIYMGRIYLSLSPSLPVQQIHISSQGVKIWVSIWIVAFTAQGLPFWMFSDHVSLLEFLLIMLLVRLNGQGHHGSDSKFTGMGNHLVETHPTVYSLLNAKKWS